MTDNQTSPPDTQKADRQYTIMVTALVLLIIAALVVLWLNERSRRVRAEADVVKVMQQKETISKLFTQFTAGGGEGMGLGMGDAGGAAARVNRDDLPTKAVTIDGQPRDALLLGGKTGERIGFRAGDVIIVAGAASSRPSASTPTATMPASAGGLEK